MQPDPALIEKQKQDQMMNQQRHESLRVSMHLNFFKATKARRNHKKADGRRGRLEKANDGRTEPKPLG
jgi:hypothetical protein